MTVPTSREEKGIVHRALWLLMGLQLGGWLRFAGRSLGTVKGAALALLGVAVFTPWLLTVVLTPPPEGRADPLTVRRYGPLLLLMLTVVSGTLAVTAQRAISFRPAEVNLLFPGPFSRRQLLAYKLTLSLGASLVASPLIALALRHHAARFLAAWVGLVLTLAFMQLFATALALLASTVGAQAYNRSRRVVLLCLIAAAAAAAFWAGGEALSLSSQDREEVFRHIEQSPMWSVLLAPFRWFVEAFLARRFWPDLVVRAGFGLAVNLALLALIFALDARYLEAAATQSERTYAQLERLRAGGMLAVGLSGSGEVRFSLPSLPWWGGVGPTLWRQLLTARRGFVPLIVLTAFYALALLPILTNADPTRHDRGGDLILAGTLFGVTVFLTTMVAYDFRADLDRMDLLKMLPIAPARLALGQLAAPVLTVSALQVLVLTAAELALGRFEAGFVLAASAFAVPFNFVIFGVENLLFLLYPTRLMAATPGDFQLMGRHMVLLLAKLVGIQLALLPAAGLGLTAGAAVIFLGADEAAALPVVLAAVWAGLAGAALGLVPLLALAFGRFDVSRDTPP